jgi:hypothetical protein
LVAPDEETIIANPVVIGPVNTKGICCFACGSTKPDSSYFIDASRYPTTSTGRS